MNNQLIEKVIKSNNGECPQFTYQNPVLDRAVATALSKNFVRLMKVTGRNSNINNNLRLSVLENIKRLCKVESEIHMKIDENVTELLTEAYHKTIEESAGSGAESTERLLNEFLLRKFKSMDMDSSIKSLVNPEVIQALSNLDENGTHLSQNKTYLHWDVHNQKCLNVLKNIWNNNNIQLNTFPEPALDDISIKIKSEIEAILLEACYKALTDVDLNLDEIFDPDICSNNPIIQLVRNCSVSPECFQISCSIMNHILITKNYDARILHLILAFVNHIKMYSPLVSIAMLYPNHLCNVVLWLDIDFKSLPNSTRKYYTQMVTSHLKTLHNENANDLILLLSHFPDWFDVYFEGCAISNE